MNIILKSTTLQPKSHM